MFATCGLQVGCCAILSSHFHDLVNTSEVFFYRIINALTATVGPLGLAVISQIEEVPSRVDRCPALEVQKS